MEVLGWILYFAIWGAFAFLWHKASQEEGVTLGQAFVARFWAALTIVIILLSIITLLGKMIGGGN